MLNNILKVYDEDLINGSLAAATVSSDKVVAVGETQGALCVNVFAKGAVSTTAAVTITLKHGDSETGSFAELSTISIAASKTFKDGELIATTTLPSTVKAYVMATATSATSNSGSIRVTLGYLAR
ncbi:MAG: hypothetical protein J6J35_03860 [Alphaproteobacteria bacterium]|nr:hypothetical protein [Alphaproteobacteria bacterium]